MASTGVDAVEAALNILVNVTENSSDVRNNFKEDILKAFSSLRNVFVGLRSEMESTNRRIVELETRAAETIFMLQALRTGVGGNGRGEQEATARGLQVNYKDNRRTTGQANGAKKRYSDAVADRPGEGGKKASTTSNASIAQTNQSKQREDETEQHTKTPTREQPTSSDEEEMEELAGFEEVTYRQNNKRRQQVIIGTSRDSESKAEKKKAWIYRSEERRVGKECRS